MIENVEDLRILRLAELYEEAYEAFVREVIARCDDDATRRRLEELQPPKDQHLARLRAHEERLRRAIEPEDAPHLLASALADVVDIERAAREFYFQHVDDVHDPALAQLFHELAREESGHVEHAEGALDDYRRRNHVPLAQPRSTEDAAPVLWEGAGDLGAASRSARPSQR